MHGASGQLDVAVQIGVYVGEVHRQKSIVFSNGGAQKERLLLIEAQRESREMARFGMKKAETGGAQRLDVAVTVEDGERVAVLKHTRAVVRQGGRCADIVFVFDADNVRQNKTVLER